MSDSIRPARNAVAVACGGCGFLYVLTLAEALKEPAKKAACPRCKREMRTTDRDAKELLEGKT